MTKHLLTILLLVFLLDSCGNDKQTTQASKTRDTIYQKINVDCDREWNNITWFDTTFIGDITFKIISRCIDNITFVDTIDADADTFLIRGWHDIEFVVNFSPFVNKLHIDKASYLEKLAPDLLDNGFLTPPRDLNFNETDSSVTFKTFIGHADSDVGDVYVLRIDKTGKTSVIAVEVSEMDDEVD